MADARSRGWGWPDDSGYRSQHIVTITVGGVRLHVRREVARLFAGFINELVTGGYRLDVVADDWGWNNRDIRGRPGVKSNHAWGLAIDLNSTVNPMTEAHPGHANSPGHDDRGVHTDMPAWVRPLAQRWGLTWGANYTGSRKDAMHFEFTGTPSDVARYPLGDRIEEDDMDLPTLQTELGYVHGRLDVIDKEIAKMETRQRQMKDRGDAILAILRKAFPEAK